MNVSDESTRSLWMQVLVCEAPRLSHAEEADAVVIGSGIAGLSVAYELMRRGRSVVVLDRGGIGSGMTARTTAHLASAVDDFYYDIIDTRGLDSARLLYQSIDAAIGRIEEIQATEQIACDFRRVDGYWVLASRDHESTLDDELKACTRLGIPAEDWRKETPFDAGGIARSLRFPNQARFHPTKYLAGLAAKLKQGGARLYADTCVASVEEAADKVVVKTDTGHEVHAAEAIVATNSPVSLRLAIHSKQAPYRTYAIAARMPRGALPDALYWDTLDPYHYVRLQPIADDFDLVIIGGEDHKSAEADDGERRFAALEHWARQRLPELGDIEHRWSGQVLEPTDGIGFIGHSPGSEHIYVVTGDSGQGITNGVVASLLITDLVTTGTSPWTEVYDPARKMKSSIGEFISENVTALKSFAEYLTASDMASIERLRPGEGAIVRSGLQKIAACRDKAGHLHVHSASCTHLGCVVHWNSLEQCWDCPCHGSQFAPDGTALNGPAVSALAPVDATGHLRAAE